MGTLTRFPGFSDSVNTVSSLWCGFPDSVFSLHFILQLCHRIQHSRHNQSTLPKFKDQKYHYSELLAKAEKNKEISDYLSWIYHAGVKSAKVDDLRNYMKYMNFNPDDSSASITYPGTSIPREF